jgi:hypothetical protein
VVQKEKISPIVFVTFEATNFTTHLTGPFVGAMGGKWWEACFNARKGFVGRVGCFFALTRLG